MPDYLPTVAVGAVTFAIAAYYLSSNKKKNYPPGPKGVPLYGNTLTLKRSDVNGPEILDKWADEFGDVYSVQLGSYDAVVLNSYSAIKEALLTYGDVTGGRQTNIFFFGKVIGKAGIILNEGDDWKATRRAALRSMRDFGMGKKSLEERVQEEARALVDMFDVQGEKEPFDPRMMLHNAFSNVICSVVFGKRYEYGDEEFIMMADTLNTAFKIGGFKSPEMFNPFLTVLMPFINPAFFKSTRKMFKLTYLIKDMIKRHRNNFDPDDIKSFIDIYLKAERDGELDDKNLEDNILASIFDVFLAGSETSLTTLRWAILYFINYPEVQAKCQQEIKEVIGESRPPTISDRPALPYIQATINELLRIASIAAYGAMHRTTDAIELSGYTIPKDTLLITNLYHVHMDEEYWGDPAVFRPERWIGPDGQLIKHEPFIPFSMGPRECLGKSLALQEIFIILVSLLQKFTFAATDSQNVPPPKGAMGLSYSPHDYEIVIKKL